ncbi:MAG: histidine--tRNA ligase [candidate division WOR-3 bacterium]
MYQRPRGTRDIWGIELERIEVINHWARNFFKKNGFIEIKTPTFESIELFVRSIGEYTDIVEKEMYTFEHNGKVFVLRPEGTAAVLRAVIENKINVPARLLYIGQMFRKERPQKGRYREFLQIGIELLGESAPFYDAEVIDLASRFLNSIGLREFFIEVNSIGCPICRASYKNRLREFIMPKLDNLCPDCRKRFEKNFLRIFDCKNDICQQFYQDTPKITDNLCPECSIHYQKVKEFLDKLDIKYQENKRLVRGLDYYTKTVFEFKLKELGAQDTIIAGGRYDLLMKELGGDDLSCVGWAMGVERTLLAIPENLPEIEKNRVFSIAIMGEKYLNEFVNIRKKILDWGQIVIPVDPCASIKRQLKAANRNRADFVIIYGDDEDSEGVYTVRDMSTGTQQKIPKEKIEKFLKDIVGR